jgi:ribosomal protein L5
MEAPRIQKITLNMGVGEAKTDTKLLDNAQDAARHHRRPECRTVRRCP